MVGVSAVVAGSLRGVCPAALPLCHPNSPRFHKRGYIGCACTHPPRPLASAPFHFSKHEPATDSHHPHTRTGLSRVVSAGRPCGGPRGEFRRARMHGDQTVGLWHLGEYAARAGWNVQGDRPPQRVFPALHPALVSRKGGRARRRLREGMRGGDASPLGV